MKGVASYDDYLGRDTDSGRFFHPKKVHPFFFQETTPSLRILNVTILIELNST